MILKGRLRRYLLPLGGMIVPVTNDAVFPLLSVFQREFNIDLATANTIVPSMMLPFALFMLISGAITVRFGRKRMLITGFLGVAAGSLVIMSATSFNYVLAGRVIQGISAAFIMPAIIASIGDTVEHHLRGKFMGLFMISIAVGTAIGPAVGGWLGEWGGITPVAGFLALFASGFGIYYHFVIPDSRQHFTQSPSISHELLLAMRSAGIVGIGLTGAAVFIALMGGMTFSAIILAREPFNMQPGSIGSVLSVALGAGIVGAILGGILTDSSGRSSTTLTGIISMIFGCFVVILSLFWLDVLGLAGFLIGLSIMGFGHAIAMTALETQSVEILPNHRDEASSLFNALRFSGYAIAPTLGVYLFSKFHDVATVYAFFCGVLVLGAVLYFCMVGKVTLNETISNSSDLKTIE